MEFNLVWALIYFVIGGIGFCFLEQSASIQTFAVGGFCTVGAWALARLFYQALTFNPFHCNGVYPDMFPTNNNFTTMP